MAEGGEDIPMNTFPHDSNVGDDKDTDNLIPEEGKGSGARRKVPFYALPTDVPGYIKTSTDKKGKQETSFTNNTPSAEDILRGKQRKNDEFEKEILDVFPHIKKKLISNIYRDGYGRLIYKGDKTFKDGVDRNIPHIIAEGGIPSYEYNLKKFPQGLKRDLGRTNEEINKEAYNKQKEEEEKQTEREKVRKEAREKLEDIDKKLLDANDRKDNLIQVLKDQKDAINHALTTENKESYTKSIEVTSNALRQVSKEINDQRVERDRWEQIERNADEIVQEGERQVETARERVNQRLLSLKDRIKEIFKKHGFTVVAVATAIGTVIAVIVSNLKAGLTKVANGVGNGLKELGAKLGQILPGMVGAIASFIFKTAGEVIGFLAKNAWLLIVGLVVLAVEQFKKKG